jgi:hypothetical protein
MRKYNRFGRSGVFTCSDCGHRTRETAGNAGLDNDLCGLCADLAGVQNGISDNGQDSELGQEYRLESLELRKQIVARGGELNDSMTWAETDPLPLEPTTTEKLGLKLSPNSQHAVDQAVAKARKERQREIARKAWAPGGCLHKKFKEPK